MNFKKLDTVSLDTNVLYSKVNYPENKHLDFISLKINVIGFKNETTIVNLSEQNLIELLNEFKK